MDCTLLSPTLQIAKRSSAKKLKRIPDIKTMLIVHKACTVQTTCAISTGYVIFHGLSSLDNSLLCTCSLLLTFFLLSQKKQNQ